MTANKTKKQQEEVKVTLTKEQILQMVKNKTNTITLPIQTPTMHPTAEQRKGIKNVSKEEFTRRVVRCGSSGHVGVSAHWVGKMVKVNMEEVQD